MGADDWRYEYLSNEIELYTRKVEESERMVKQAKQELEATEWQYNKNKTILEMLEVAYKVNVTSCAQKGENKQ
jgi:hypothetical protein